MAGRFEGRRALVTGAAGGIGRSVVELLAEEGARVEGVDLREAEGVQPCDVSDAASVASAVGAASSVTGAVLVVDRGTAC